MENNLCVIGLGRVGLPLALSFAEAGLTVYGIDINEELISLLLKKEMPFIEDGAKNLLSKHAGISFFPTFDTFLIKKCKYVILTLGTPTDEHLNPDFSQIESILPVLKTHLSVGQLILLRSTVSPGTTELIKDYLEKDTGKKAGKDFFVAFCPERIAEGKAIEEIKEVPQIIGGIDETSSKLAESLFSKITKKCMITDAKSAELAKIFTNMYRYINFAIANEFAILAQEHSRNIFEIIDLVNKDYKRGGLKKPGFTAGPCLYKDGFFLLNTIPFSDLITTSWRINENFPLYLMSKIKDRIGLKGKKVAILGVSFKKNIDDSRNSLSFKLKKAFTREGATVIMHDPFIKGYSGDLKAALAGASVVVVAVNHDNYLGLYEILKQSGLEKSCIICDVWNMTKKDEMIYVI